MAAIDAKDKETTDFEEPSLDDFFHEEVDPKREKIKKRRTFIIRSVAAIIAFVFIVNAFLIFVPVFNLPAIAFLKSSFELSKREDIQQYKKAVVSIEGDNKKGTGFNIASDGYIITNFHVIEDMKPIVVYFNDGQVYHASLEQGFPEVDLAFLNIDGVNLPTLSFAKDGRLENGDSIYVVGNPLGFYQIANKGKVIGQKGVGSLTIPALAITAPVYRGNSGSPVIDEAGKVVGVVFATNIPRVRKDEELEGLVIPIEEVVTRLH